MEVYLKYWDPFLEENFEERLWDVGVSSYPVKGDKITYKNMKFLVLDRNYDFDNKFVYIEAQRIA